MISSWMLYLITRLDAITIVLSIMNFISVVFIPVTIVGALCERYTFEEILKWTWFRCLIITAITSGLLLIATPSTKEAVAIWLVPKVVNNEDVQGSISKLPKFANKYLEEQLKEYTEGK